MTLAEREAELIEIFEWIEDETDRYVQIMDYGKKMPEFPESERIELTDGKFIFNLTSPDFSTNKLIS